MFVINVLPLSRTAPGILSYRSKEDLPAGSVVDITLRRTATQGIVISSLPVQDAKEMIKHARFLLSSSIPSASGKLPESVMQAAEEVAEYHATSVGAVLSSLFAEYIRSGAALPGMDMAEGSGYVREVVECDVGERAEVYKKKIEECQERGFAALLVAPTLAECEYWKKVFSTYAPLVITGSVSGPARERALAKAANYSGVIITTPSFSWIPISKLGIILVDRVSAGAYTLPKRPYLSILYALTSLAKARAIPLMFGDFPVPLEYRPNPKLPIAKTPTNVEVIDVRLPKGIERDTTVPWKALTEPTLERIRTEISEGGRVVVLATRKGYAPAVVCKDCGQAQTDDRGVPLLFSIAHGTRVFVSRDGVQVIDASRRCMRCDSWNLLPLGVGVERVVEELQDAFPGRTIHTLTAELLTSRKAAKMTIKDAQRPGSILVGTEALLPWLQLYEGPKGLRPLGIIASADSLLSLPFWRSRERFIRLSYFMSGLCSTVILLTRRPEDSAVQTLDTNHAGSIEVTSPIQEFWEEEDALRTALHYPPYGTLVTLAIDANATTTEKFHAQILKDLSSYSPSILPAHGTIVISLPSKIWPDKTLSTYIRALSPSVRVRIDPESLW